MKKRYFKFIIAVVYIAALITTISSHAQVISTYAGSGSSSSGGDGGAATSAGIRYPSHTIFDASGNMYIAEWGYNRIRKVTTSGSISTIAGTGVPLFGGDGGAATAAYLNQPCGIVIDASGNIIFVDNGNKRVRKINGAGTISTIVGTGVTGYSGDGGQATAAMITDPRGLALDAAGNLFIADAGNQVIRKVNTSGIISTVAGNNTSGFSGDGSAATTAQLNNPQDVAFDAAGNMYISDNLNHRIRKVTTTGTISTFAGTGSLGFSGDGGAATAARLKYPYGLQIDAYDNMYIADGGNNRIRKIKPSGIISTVAGTSSFGFSGDGGPATAAQLNSPGATSKDASGNLYISDELNYRIRKVTASLTVSGTSTVCAGSTITLTGSESGGTWTSSITGYATVGSSSGIVTGVAAGIVTISYTESGITGTKTITVDPLPAPITGTFTVCVGASTHLSCTSGGGAWVSSSPTIGSIDGLGNVTGVSAGTTVITYALLPSLCQTTVVVTVDPCSTLGVSGIPEKDGVSIFPNPSAGSVIINVPDVITAVIILDQMGREVYSKNMTTNGMSTALDLSNVAPGNYIIKTITKGQVYTNRLELIRQ